MLLVKIIYYIYHGLLGIIKNKQFKTKTKLILLFDYFNLLLKLVKATLLKTKYNFVKIRAFNLILYFDSIYTFFYVFNEIFCMVVYPPIKNVKLYIDVGANIGISILWNRLFNPNCSVLAFEPNAKYFEYLKKNLKINNIKGVKIYPLCISNKTGNAKFYLINDIIQSLNSGLILNRNLPHKIIDVRTDRLSRYINQSVSLLKMDVEGAEYDILEDLFNTGKIKFIEKIIYEAHFYNPYEISGYKKTLRQLETIGRVKSKIITEYGRANYFERFTSAR